jgi:hypothetical protein
MNLLLSLTKIHLTKIMTDEEATAIEETKSKAANSV